MMASIVGKVPPVATEMEPEDIIDKLKKL